MEEKYEIPQLDKERYSIFVVIHIALCLLVFFYTKEVTEYRDILGLFSMIIAAIGNVFYSIAMFVWSAVLLIPFRFATVKKNTHITEYEVQQTLETIGIGVVLTLVAGVLFTGIWSLLLMGMLLLPVLIFELTVYWLSLRGRNRAGALQDISLENASQTMKEDYKEVKRVTRVSGVMRFAFFTVIHIALCAAAFIYMKYGYFGPPGILWWSAVLLTLLRLITVRESTRVTDIEVKGTLAVMAAGVVLSLTVGVLFMGTTALWLMGIIFLPVLIFEITVYWSALWEQSSPGDKKDIPLENASQVMPGEHKENKHRIWTTDTMRFMTFIVIHIVLCISVFSCAKNTGTISFGSGFYMLISTLSAATMMVQSAILLVPLRFITIKKSTRVTDVEVNRTLKVMVAGGVLSLAAGVLFIGIRVLLLMGILFLPVFILEITVYWFSLLERKIVQSTYSLE